MGWMAGIVDLQVRGTKPVAEALAVSANTIRSASSADGSVAIPCGRTVRGVMAVTCSKPLPVIDLRTKRFSRRRGFGRREPFVGGSSVHSRHSSRRIGIRGENPSKSILSEL